MQRRTLLSLALGGSAIALAGCSRSGSNGPAKVETPETLTTLNFYTDKAAWEPSFKEMNKASKATNLELKFTGYSDPTAYDSLHQAGLPHQEDP